MNADLAVQRAVRAAMLGHPLLGVTLSGVFDGPPPRAAYPYASFAGGSVLDWSTKDRTGRELRVGVNLWDSADEGAGRLPLLADALVAAVATVPRDLDGWQVASLVFVSARTLRTAAGPWVSLAEHRVRLLAK